MTGPALQQQEQEQQQKQHQEQERQRFRRTLAKVMTMQVVALLLLWWLQATFTR